VVYRGSVSDGHERGLPRLRKKDRAHVCPMLWPWDPGAFSTVSAFFVFAFGFVVGMCTLQSFKRGANTYDVSNGETLSLFLIPRG
jgi:hypothetical protein